MTFLSLAAFFQSKRPRPWSCGMLAQLDWRRTETTIPATCAVSVESPYQHLVPVPPARPKAVMYATRFPASADQDSPPAVPIR